jgi:hypothetical protein
MWTDVDEADLKELKKEELTLANTETGQMKKKKQNEAFAAIAAASPGTRMRYRQLLAEEDTGERADV